MANCYMARRNRKNAGKTSLQMLMAAWVVFNCDWVWPRYCRATIAPVLVLTLKDMDVSPFWFGP